MAIQLLGQRLSSLNSQRSLLLRYFLRYNSAIFYCFDCLLTSSLSLRSYAWASESGLDVLVRLMDEATDSLNWKAVRQWGDEQDATAESLRDAVILYDRSIYIGTGIEKPEVGAFRDNDDLLAGMQSDIKAQLAGFIGRWAGI